jgi:REP element-mobilizing transposase RayT
MTAEGATANATALGSAGILPALSAAATPHWHSRGYLPHFEGGQYVQALTFRLHDSLPKKIVDEWRHELTVELATTAHTTPATPGVATLQDRIETELRRRIFAYEDAGHGACYLRDPHVAGIVQNALLYFDAQRYRLIAWCVMPNHVHVVIEPIVPHLLSDIEHSWKSFTAKAANKHLCRKGAFWMREYYDRYIRNPAHLASAINYTEDNPVKAGLVASKTQWRWSSMHWERRRSVGTNPTISRQDAGAPSR